MQGVNIVLGVSGCLDAYKACDLTRQLKKMGAQIDVIMTASACKFVAPLTFESLALNRVITDMFDPPKNWDIEHVSLAKKADVLVIAPASAELIGKLANGIADDMLTTTVMACQKPVIIAPSMDGSIFASPLVQANLAKLAERGYVLIDPMAGEEQVNNYHLASLAPLSYLVAAIEHYALRSDDLEGLKMVITAGPTVERLDPVRYLTNRSTGKMGYDLAKIAAQRGAQVTLVSGPSQVPVPYGVECVTVSSAMDMFHMVMAHIDQAHVFIGAAAVADYRPSDVSSQKIKKKEGDLAISLARNHDILKTVGLEKKHCMSVGFSVETENVIENSRKKFETKQLDLLVINDVTQEGAGFGTSTNLVSLMTNQGVEALPLMSKEAVAGVILDRVNAHINKK